MATDQQKPLEDDEKSIQISLKVMDTERAERILAIIEKEEVLATCIIWRCSIKTHHHN